mmetsp:Transcript_89064/g.241560  ORF Transcript_89064/g.241560 Transcript_89064/m.241560 type:complete len:397 (+) Transcript_89064:1451-2641(+)
MNLVVPGPALFRHELALAHHHFPGLLAIRVQDGRRADLSVKPLALLRLRVELHLLQATDADPQDVRGPQILVLGRAVVEVAILSRSRPGRPRRHRVGRMRGIRGQRRARRRAGAVHAVHLDRARGRGRRARGQAGRGGALRQTRLGQPQRLWVPEVYGPPLQPHPQAGTGGPQPRCLALLPGLSAAGPIQGTPDCAEIGLLFHRRHLRAVVVRAGLGLPSLALLRPVRLPSRAQACSQLVVPPGIEVQLSVHVDLLVEEIRLLQVGPRAKAQQAKHADPQRPRDLVRLGVGRHLLPRPLDPAVVVDVEVEQLLRRHVDDEDMGVVLLPHRVHIRLNGSRLPHVGAHGDDHIRISGALSCPHCAQLPISALQPLSLKDRDLQQASGLRARELESFAL